MHSERKPASNKNRPQREVPDPVIPKEEAEYLNSKYNTYAEEIRPKLEEAVAGVYKALDAMDQNDYETMSATGKDVPKPVEQLFLSGGLMGMLAYQLGKAKFRFCIAVGKRDNKRDARIAAQIAEHMEQGLADAMAEFLTRDEKKPS